MQNLQWGLRAIRWFNAKRPSAKRIKVAVLDTGVDKGHPDLKRVVVTYDHTGLRSTDILGHGTHVAGIIAATTNNNVGISGVATCSLAVWKIFPDKPVCGEFYVDTNILSTLPRKRSRYLAETGYGAWSGTSMACPHVAAAAALLVAREGAAATAARSSREGTVS